MGLPFSRQDARVEELDLSPSNAYRYPPKSGNYFASHFIMGGERFETTQPEAYLFGENMDLNFLGGKPTPFPYPAPQPNEPTRTLRSLINIRKESLRFVRAVEEEHKVTCDGGSVVTSYNIEFTFDSDVRCGITINYFCTEEITANGVFYTPRDPNMSSETYHYKKGVNQQFSQVSHVFVPSKYTDDMLLYKFEDDIIPVLIQCVAEEGEESRQSHMLIAVVEKNADETYVLKPLKQKLYVDGLCYLLQEIYGIENKNVYQSKDISDDEVEDSGSECVICMSDARDTLILPCRHLCLCNNCADSLRYQANNCPICRAPFRALLQIRAVCKSPPNLPQVSHSSDNQPALDVPPGYEAVSLIEALNGPILPTAPLVPPFPPSIPPFSKSPDIRQKQRQLDRHHSNSTVSLTPAESICSVKEGPTKLEVSVENSPPPEVIVCALVSQNKISNKAESLSLTRGEAKRHRKGFRTSSAPEKIRLLANSVQIVNEVGGAKRKIDIDAEAAETRSLLENNLTLDEGIAANSLPKVTRTCNRTSPVSLSTPHSLHLCEKSSKIPIPSDTSPGGEDSDYYTPEDPSTSILVDQATDTSLDILQDVENLSNINNVTKKSLETSHCGKKYSRERHVDTSDNSVATDNLNNIMLNSSDSTINVTEKFEVNETSYISASKQPLVVQLETSSSLPGTPASNISNNSSGDSFSSTSSSRLLLQHQSFETLPE